MSIDDPIRFDRAAGALVGLATGDALGAGYEFTTPTGDVGMIGGGLGPFEPGEWTDDTQMAICVAKPAARGDLGPHAVGAEFIEWFGSRPKDVGNQTRAVLSGARSPAELSTRAAEYFRRNPRNSAGNGSLMRTAAVALAHLGDDEAIAASARAISELTHGDPLAGDACVLWCVAIDRAVREGRLDGARDALPLVDARWSGWIAEAETKPPSSFNPNGFVVHAFQAALAAVTQTPVPLDRPCRHLQDALQSAVRIGHDTDTVAAIAGSLLGAHWGASGIPIRWTSMLHGWPGHRARDLVRLAILSARGGAPDAAGWPAASSLEEYYRERFGWTPVAVALPQDEGVLIGNVAALREVDADVVLSLCRIGAGDCRGADHHEPWLIDAASSNPNLRFVLDDLATQIAHWRDGGRTVFVHCVQAESRTPTVAAAYLCKRFGMDAAEAFRCVRAVLPDARDHLLRESR